MVALAVALLFANAPAHATVVVPLTRAELVQRSDMVVQATIVAQRSEWNPDHSQMRTFTRILIGSWLKGASPVEFEIEQTGGSVGGRVSHVAGDAWLTPGQQAVLFLRTIDGHYYLTALSQSVYFIDVSAAHPTVRRDVSQLTFARPSNGRYVLVPPTLERAESLAQLVGDVTRLARGAR
jgi:hypothetical protein